MKTKPENGRIKKEIVKTLERTGVTLDNIVLPQQSGNIIMLESRAKKEARMGRKGRISVEKKFALVMMILKGEKSVEEIARESGISSQSGHRWKHQFLEAGKRGLFGNGKNSRENELEKELENAKRVIGEITMANDILKKTLKS